MSWGQDLPLGKAHHTSCQQTVLLTKPEGYVMFMALGKRCLPCHVAWRTVSPWVPMSVPSNFFPSSQGTWGAWPAAPHFCLLFSTPPGFSAAKLGLLAPVLLWGGRDRVFAAPSLSGNSGHPSALYRTLFTGQLFPDLG